MKIHIYQIFTRLFGNKNCTNKQNGSIVENGCGKFNDITTKSLEEIKSLGMTHVWFTGILEHASLTSYEADNIFADHPDFVKGKAGSPYAIRDYYNVCPDLAVLVSNRMDEFEEPPAPSDLTTLSSPFWASVVIRGTVIPRVWI